MKMNGHIDLIERGIYPLQETYTVLTKPLKQHLATTGCRLMYGSDNVGSVW
jgi:hypothetical protein